MPSKTSSPSIAWRTGPYLAIFVTVTALILFGAWALELSRSQDRLKPRSTSLAMELAPKPINQSIASELIKAGKLELAREIRSPLSTSVKKLNYDKPLQLGGKPEILYFGAEYCPFSAAQRWALVIALDRFGKFSGLREISSSPKDVFPNTATFTFYGASYKSKYVAFDMVEQFSNVPIEYHHQVGYVQIEQPTDQEEHLYNTLSNSPYTPDTAQPGSIPLLDYGNRFISVGSSFSPGLIQGRTIGSIAKSLATDAKDAGTIAIASTANNITAAVCALTGDTPARVCETPGVTAAKGAID